MNKAKLSLLLSYAAVVFLAGCGSQPFEAKEQICISAADKADVMGTAEDVLARMHFVVEKADTEQGVIRTKPLRAAQSFEIWRNDNVGQFNKTEANLHTIRRTAELAVAEQNGQVCINCDVQVQRMGLPEQEISSETQVPGMFTMSKSSVQKLELREEQKGEMVWIDLGRDNRLETEILKRIEKKLNR